MAVICLITPGQPSSNPRLVKEADALVEAGHLVHVVCAHWAKWADETDGELLKSRAFACRYVGGKLGAGSLIYQWTRVRHRIGKELAKLRFGGAQSNWALCRVGPELQRAAGEIRADLYIAHNLGALPAALHAARRRNAKLGFDAEDFHSGMSPLSEGASGDTLLTERVERSALPMCDYVTAASPLIAERYSTKYDLAVPTTILNVFPLKLRPLSFVERRNRHALKLCWFSQTVGSGRGLEDVVRAMGRMPELPTEIHIKGEWQVGFRRELDALARSVGLPASCIQADGTAPPDDLVRWTSEWDIGIATEQPVSLNRDICLTNKIFTYLLAGNAILATATAAQRRLLRDIPGAGYCYEAGDIDELARLLRVWHQRRASLNEARRRAWDYGTAMFNWDREKLKFLSLVANTLSSPASSRP